eukprot:1754968-Prymnesium_polylepis.2
MPCTVQRNTRQACMSVPSSRHTRATQSVCMRRLPKILLPSRLALSCSRTCRTEASGTYCLLGSPDTDSHSSLATLASSSPVSTTSQRSSGAWTLDGLAGRSARSTETGRVVAGVVDSLVDTSAFASTPRPGVA